MGCKNVNKSFSYTALSKSDFVNTDTPDPLDWEFSLPMADLLVKSTHEWIVNNDSEVEPAVLHPAELRIGLKQEEEKPISEPVENTNVEPPMEMLNETGGG